MMCRRQVNQHDQEPYVTCSHFFGSVIVVASLLLGVSAFRLDVSSTAHADTDWARLQPLLQDCTGVTTNPSPLAESTMLPEAPLLGNGEIGIAVRGNQKRLSLLVDHAFFRRYALGGVDIIAEGNPGPAPLAARHEQDIQRAEFRSRVTLNGFPVEATSWLATDPPLAAFPQPPVAPHKNRKALPNDQLDAPAFLAMNFLYAYETTLARDFLERKAYPMVRACMAFYADYLVLANARYELHASAAREGTSDNNPAYPLAFIKRLANACADYSEVLGVDADLRAAAGGSHRAVHRANDGPRPTRSPRRPLAERRFLPGAFPERGRTVALRTPRGDSNPRHCAHLPRLEPTSHVSHAGAQAVGAGRHARRADGDAPTTGNPRDGRGGTLRIGRNTSGGWHWL